MLNIVGENLLDDMDIISWESNSDDVLSMKRSPYVLVGHSLDGHCTKSDNNYISGNFTSEASSLDLSGPRYTGTTGFVISKDVRFGNSADMMCNGGEGGDVYHRRFIWRARVRGCEGGGRYVSPWSLD